MANNLTTCCLTSGKDGIFLMLSFFFASVLVSEWGKRTWLFQTYSEEIFFP